MQNKNPNIKKCVLIGDEGVGKTSLLIAYTRNKFPEFYVPDILDTCAINVKLKNRTYTLGLFDTCSGYEHDLSKTNVVLLCFSLDEPKSLQNAKEKWFPMINKNNAKVNIILVGLKSDLKIMMDTNLSLSNVGEKVAKEIGCKRYLECSAKLQRGIVDIFNEGIRASSTSTICDRITKNCILM